MRIYFYLTVDEIIRAGAFGLDPATPKTTVNKLLQDYISQHPKKVSVGCGKEVELTTKAIYGGLVAQAMNIHTKSLVYKDGVFVFIRVNNTCGLPAVCAKYIYRAKIHELLLLKNEADDVQHGKFKTYQEGIKYYIKKYWDSVVSLRIVQDVIRRESYSKYSKLNEAYAMYKVADLYEVLFYRHIPPQALYFKLEHKKYMPFLEWLYRHRGLYLRWIKESKTPMQEQGRRDVYKKFLENYKKMKTQWWYGHGYRKNYP